MVSNKLALWIWQVKQSKQELESEANGIFSGQTEDLVRYSLVRKDKNSKKKKIFF